MNKNIEMILPRWSNNFKMTIDGDFAYYNARQVLEGAIFCGLYNRFILSYVKVNLVVIPQAMRSP